MSKVHQYSQKSCSEFGHILLNINGKNILKNIKDLLSILQKNICY